MERPELELLERSLAHAVEHNTGPALDAELEELGFGEALNADPRSSISVLFGLQGRANVVSSALNAVLLSAAGGAEQGTIVVLPAFGDWQPPGLVEHDQLAVSGLRSGPAEGWTRALIFAREGERSVVAAVPADALDVHPIDGIDPNLGLSTVTGTLATGDRYPADWASVLAVGQLAVSHELIGAARSMLELAREHALNRIQFGQPISRFQAVRHRLADTVVAIETADAMLDAAWLDAQPESAATAKALAGRGALLAARHCQQVLAGIGFTAEHPFHHYFRRVLVLDGLLGSSRLLTTAFGQRLLESRRLPELLAL